LGKGVVACELELAAEAVGFKGDETKEVVVGVEWERPGVCLRGGEEEEEEGVGGEDRRRDCSRWTPAI